MKTHLFASIAVCGAVFAVLLFYGNTQADPLTPTATVKVTTLVRVEGTPPKVISLVRNEVFLFNGLSVRAGDSVDVIFTKNGESFRVNTTAPPGFFDLLDEAANAAEKNDSNLTKGYNCIRVRS